MVDTGTNQHYFLYCCLIHWSCKLVLVEPCSVWLSSLLPGSGGIHKDFSLWRVKKKKLSGLFFIGPHLSTVGPKCELYWCKPPPWFIANCCVCSVSKTASSACMWQLQPNAIMSMHVGGSKRDVHGGSECSVNIKRRKVEIPPSQLYRLCTCMLLVSLKAL